MFLIQRIKQHQEQNFAYKHLEYNNIDNLVQVWDTADQEDFHSITRAYYKAAVVAMVVYDISSKECFKHIQSWIKDCKDLAPKTVQLILIWNKNYLKYFSKVPTYLAKFHVILEEQRAIQKESGEELAQENKMYFLNQSFQNKI